MVAVDGMVLLARLYVDTHFDKRTKAKVIAKLDNFSKGPGALDAAYSEVITRIDSQLPGDRTLATSILSWIVCAQRSLSTTELCHALAVETEDKELDLNNILDIEDIVSVCAGLVVIDEEVDVVRLVHYTAQKYLKSVLEDWNRDAQLNIASACFTYLCLNPFGSGSCPTEDEIVCRLDQNPFFDYAARYWGHHVAPVQEEVSELAMRLLYDVNLVESVFEASCTGYYWKNGKHAREFPIYAKGLHLTAARGLLHLSKVVLPRMATDSLSTADVKDDDDRTPLVFAAREGHEMVVRMLLERKDVKVDSKDWIRQTPLSFAAANGHEAVIRLSIERDDVEADSKNSEKKTPLLLAAENGKEAVVKLLAERDDVETD